VPWQRCQMHLQRKAQAYVTKQSLKAEVAADLRSVFNSSSHGEALTRLSELAEKYATSQPRLASWMEENMPKGLTVFAFPATVRQYLRINNMEENINKQIKTQTRLIASFPNTASLIRLVSAICAEVSDEWETQHHLYMTTISRL